MVRHKDLRVLEHAEGSLSALNAIFGVNRVIERLGLRGFETPFTPRLDHDALLQTQLEYNRAQSVTLSSSEFSIMETSDQHDNARRTWLEQSKAERLEQVVKREAEYKRALAPIKEEYNKDMHALHIQISTLNSEMNSLVPIARVPPEILSRIFIVLDDYFRDQLRSTTDEMLAEVPYIVPDTRREERPRNPRMELPRTKYPWQTLRVVCKQWHNIVQQIPALFACIAPSTRNVVDFAVDHSGTVPLDILWNSYRYQDGLGRALRQLPRLGSLFLVISKEIVEKLTTMKTGTLVAPQMTSIYYRLHYSAMRYSVPLLSDLDTPNLTALKTNGGSLSQVATFMRPTLTILDMSKWSQRDWGHVMTLIQPLTNLHTLSLRFTAKDKSALTPVKPITLAKLTSLVLYDRDYCEGIAQFLDRIACPMLTTLKCWSGLSEQRCKLDDSLTKALKTKMDTTELSGSFLPRTIAIRNSWVTMAGEGLVNVLGVWTTERHSSMLSDVSKWEPEEGSFIAPRIRSVHDIITRVLPIFNLAHVTVIWIEHCTKNTPLSTWQMLFRSTPNVHTLRVCDFEYLVDLLQVPEPDSSEALILPKLKILNLRCVNKQDLLTLGPLVSTLQARQEFASGPVEILDRLELCTVYYDLFEDDDIWFLRDAEIAKVVHHAPMQW